MSQCETLLAALKRGERLTVADALTHYGIYALSQRAGELRRSGHPVVSEMVAVGNGKRVAQYSYVAPSGNVVQVFDRPLSIPEIERLDAPRSAP